MCLCVLPVFNIMFAQLFVNRAEKAIKASGTIIWTKVMYSSRSGVFSEENPSLEAFCEVLEC